MSILQSSPGNITSIAKVWTSARNVFVRALFPKQFTVRGSQCFKEWSPWCWMVWSGSRPACLPLPFICLPVLFICLPVLFICFPQAGCLWSGSRLSFHLSPSSFHLSPNSFICLPGWVLVVGFICLPLLFICLSGWVLVVGFGSRLACLPLPFILVRFPAGLSPTSLHLSPISFYVSPASFVSHVCHC